MLLVGLPFEARVDGEHLPAVFSHPQPLLASGELHSDTAAYLQMLLHTKQLDLLPGPNFEFHLFVLLHATLLFVSTSQAWLPAS